MATVTAWGQPGDFRGEAMADNAAHNDIYALARAKGIVGLPVALDFHCVESGRQYVTIYTAESGSKFEEIEAEAKANGGTLRVKCHDLEGATVADLLKLFKRFSVVLRYRFPSVEQMEYERA